MSQTCFDLFGPVLTPPSRIKHWGTSTLPPKWCINLSTYNITVTNASTSTNASITTSAITVYNTSVSAGTNAISAAGTSEPPEPPHFVWEAPLLVKTVKSGGSTYCSVHTICM
jgi:hypothetical protein